MLTVTDLTCRRQQTFVFQNISFEIQAGMLLVLKGPNGSGKSSLLRMLSSLSTPFSGEILWNHHSIFKNLSVYREHIYFVGHQNGLKLGLTVNENIKLMESLFLTAPVDSLKYLKLLELHHKLETKTCFLSAGQRRRLALFKLMMFPKTLWLLDEPFAALDHHSKSIITRLIESHLKSGGMIVLSTHEAVTFNGAKIKELSLS